MSNNISWIIFQRGLAEFIQLLVGIAKPLNRANVACGLFLQLFEILFFPILFWVWTYCILLTKRLIPREKKTMINNPYIVLVILLRSLYAEHHQHVPGLPQPLSEWQVYPHVWRDRISLRVQHGIQAEWKRRVLWLVLGFFLSVLNWRHMRQLNVSELFFLFSFQMMMNVKEVHVHMESVWTPQGPTSVSVPLDSRALQPGQSAEVSHPHPRPHTPTHTKGMYLFTFGLFVSGRSGWVCGQRSHLQQWPLSKHRRKLPLCLQCWIWDIVRWEELSRFVKISTLMVFISKKLVAFYSKQSTCNVCVVPLSVGAVI